MTYGINPYWYVILTKFMTLSNLARTPVNSGSKSNLNCIVLGCVKLEKKKKQIWKSQLSPKWEWVMKGKKTCVLSKDERNNR